MRPLIGRTRAQTLAQETPATLRSALNNVWTRSGQAG